MLRQRLKGSKLILQVGNNRRYDPGVAFAAKFIREELGERMAMKMWYCDSTYRYTMTDNLQPIPMLSAQAKRPEGNPKADKRRYFMLTHGSHIADTARFLGGELVSVRSRLVEKFGAYCWFTSVDFADGGVGLLDLTIAVRGDFQEGFQIWGEKGSVQGRVYLPWFYKSADVECFSIKDGQYHRPLGEDGYSYKRQVEGFADTILHGKPLTGASIDDGVAAMRAMTAIARSVESGELVHLAKVNGGV
jgi:predicted dehydrogenase